jgi:hypothetical protein
MYIVNRSIAIIKPKHQFVDWANSVSDKGYQFSISDLSIEYNIVLLPEYDLKEDTEAIIKELYNDIFEVELSGWITDKSKWPKNRTFEKFLEWFDVEFHSMVFDPFEDNIDKEPYEF